MSSIEKARETRQKNQAARAELYREQAEAVRGARQALQRVLDSPEATAAELLEAAKLLTELSGTRR